jgi:hypothetical protein
LNNACCALLYITLKEKGTIVSIPTPNARKSKIPKRKNMQIILQPSSCARPKKPKIMTQTLLVKSEPSHQSTKSSPKTKIIIIIHHPPTKSFRPPPIHPPNVQFTSPHAPHWFPCTAEFEHPQYVHTHTPGAGPLMTTP